MSKIDKSKGEFHIMFKVAVNRSFDVAYCHYLDNKTALFCTCATIMSRNNWKYLALGQCQETALRGNGPFLEFFRKWDPRHEKRMHKATLKELEHDLAKLKASGAPYIEAADGASDDFSIWEQRKLLALKPHKAYRIKWVTDGATLKECGLPTSVTVPFYMGEDEVSDWLSDTYGYRHDGFCTNFTQS